MLKTLYKEGVVGEEVEFLAYRIIYSAVTGVTGSNINTVLARGCAMRSEPAVAHALAVRAALTEDNAVDWFRLLGAAPKMGAELMDVRTEEVRFKYLTTAAKVFRPAVPVAHLARVLGFTAARATPAATPAANAPQTTVGGSDNGDSRATATGAGPGAGPGSAIDDGGSGGGGEGMGSVMAPRVVLPPPTYEEEVLCATWLEEHGATLVDLPPPAAAAAGEEEGGGGGEGAMIRKAMDGKESAPNLFVPEDKNAVAHGDQTLDIEDFLSKAV